MSTGRPAISGHYRPCWGHTHGDMSAHQWVTVPPTLHRGLDFHGGMKSGETHSRRRERSPWKASGGMHWRAL